MNNSRVLFALLVCSALCCLSWTKPEPPTTVQEWEQRLKAANRQAYSMYAAVSLSAASSGKSLLQRPEILTDDCVRTAAVALNLFGTPSTMSKATAMLRWTGPLLLNDTSNQYAVEFDCKLLNEASKTFGFSDFEQLKAQVQLPKPSKNYVIEVPEGANIFEIMKKPYVIDDAGLIKFFVILTFMTGSEQKAVLELSENPGFKSAADEAFVRVRDLYIDEALKKPISSADLFTARVSPYEEFNKKVDQEFRKNSPLKDEYEKLVDGNALQKRKGLVEVAELETNFAV